MQCRDPWLGSLMDLTTKHFANAESWNDVHLFWCVPAPVCFVYNYTNVCFVSWVLLIKRSARYKALIWIIVCSRVWVCVSSPKTWTVHMWSEQHVYGRLSSPLLLHSREQMLGDSSQPQQISAWKATGNNQWAILLTKRNTFLVAGGVEGWGEAFSCNVSCCGHGGGGVRVEVKLCQGCECVGEKLCGAASLQTCACLW